MKTLFLTICLFTAGFSTEAFAKDTVEACKQRALKVYEKNIDIFQNKTPLAKRKKKLEKELEKLNEDVESGEISIEESGIYTQGYNVELMDIEDKIAFVILNYNKQHEERLKNCERAGSDSREIESGWTCAEDSQCQMDKIDAMSGEHSGSGY